MDILQRGMMTIIKSALSGAEGSLPEEFNFAQAASVAKKHGIVALFYYGALRCGIEKSDPLMRELFFHTCQAISVSEQQLSAATRIFECFDEAGIDYMPLKGTLLKGIYPKSEMRTMGDADILIRTEQYDKIKPVMLKLGYEEQVESDHELIWHKGTVHIELHKRLIPSYNKDYYEYFGDGWRLAKLCDAEGTRYGLKAEDELIYIFTHFAKHYRDAGIGIRHVLDIWVYKNAHEEIDEEYIKNELQALKLYDFYVNVIKTLEVWFGGCEPDGMTDFVTAIIFSSGVYGTREAQILSEAVKASKSLEKTRNVRAVKLIREIFLPYKAMCKKFPILRRAPILLPVMWVVRWVDALLFRRKNIAIKTHKLQTMTADKIDGYQQALNYVGLDFNFKE